MTTPLENFMGGYEFYQPFTASLILSRKAARVQKLYPGGGDTGLYVRLPDARVMTLGGPHFLLDNGGSADIEIQDGNGDQVGGGDLQTTKGWLMYLLDNNTLKGVWQRLEYTAL